jgi:hypothetical protein
MILFEVLTKKFVKESASQFQNFHVNFQKFHALFSMRLLQLGYDITSFVQDEFRKYTRLHKMQRMALALTFLEQYHKAGDDFLHHIMCITGDETWVSLVNAEIKEQSKQWMAYIFTKQAVKV